MKISAIGRGSISSFLKLVVDIAWVLACAALGFVWIVVILSVIVIMGGGKAVPVMFERVTYQTPLQVFLLATTGTVFCSGTMVVCSYLRGVFETLVSGDPFVPQNARRFRMIAIVLATLELVRMFGGFILQVSLGLISSGTNGATPAVSVEPVTWVPALLFWFSVLTLLVLSEVFRAGAAMREEQKMTI